MNKEPMKKERLYNLLPGIYRQRDTKNGYALRAFMNLLEKEMEGVKEDIEGLYDDWFVDTCDDWILPYIGRLFGIDESTVTGMRGRVANAIRHRRRKGTRPVLESAAYDAGGCHAMVVEFAERVAMTNSIASDEIGRKSTFDFRDQKALKRFGSPFDEGARTADIRSISSSLPIKGRYNLNAAGVFLWRLQSREFSCNAAIHPDGEGRFFFDPTGADFPLFNKAEKKSDLAMGAEIFDLPVMLNRNIIAEDLQIYEEEYKDIPESHAPGNSLYYGPEKAFGIFVKKEAVSPRRLISADLGEWSENVFSRVFNQDGKDIAVDVERGRILFADKSLKGEVSVFFHYGFSADIGGGTYDRRETLTTYLAEEFYAEASGNPDENRLTLSKALELWRVACEKSGEKPLKGIIRIMDNHFYEGDIPVHLPAGCRLAIEAADGKRPCIGRIKISEPSERKGEGELILNGLRIGGLVLLKSGLSLKILHCTIMPFNFASQKVIAADKDARDISMKLSRCITASLNVSPETVISVNIEDSIIDGGKEEYAISSAKSWGPVAIIKRTTIFGKTSVKELTASETIFTEKVSVEHRQIGHVRYCYIPPESSVPVRYKCKSGSKESDPHRPDFVSIKYGNPAYAQLEQSCPDTITKGAEQGLEIGVFNHLHMPEREKECLGNTFREIWRVGFFM
jgi:hypothetical protein